MTCAIYARFARDEERAYKTEVCNELLKAFGLRIPMRSYKPTPSMVEGIDQWVNFGSGESTQQAAERIKHHILGKKCALEVIRVMEMGERCKPSLFTRLERNRLLASG